MACFIYLLAKQPIWGRLHLTELKLGKKEILYLDPITSENDYMKCCLISSRNVKEKKN